MSWKDFRFDWQLQANSPLHAHFRVNIAHPDGKTIDHILLVQFHHTRGPEVEFSYPPLGKDAHDLPEQWKLLPFYALPGE